MKSLIIAIVKFSISFLILAYLFVQAWQTDQFQQLSGAEKRWGWMVLALAAGLLATVVSFYRWWALVRALDIPFRLYDAIRLGFISHIFNFLSVGVFGGDAVRAVAAARLAPQRIPETVAAVFVDRAIGLWSMFVFASVAYWTLDFSSFQANHPETLAAIQTVCGFTTVISILTLVGAVIVFALKESTLERWDRWLISIPKLGSLFSRLHNVVRVFRRNKPQLFAASLNSMSINALFAISVYCVAHGISDTHPTLLQHLVISPIALVANAAPLPGGLGGMEFALDVLYKAFSQIEVPTEHGFVVALGFRIIWLIIAGIGGFFYFANGSQRKWAAEALTLQRQDNQS